ncbi:MAG: hypothetical protein ACR2J8_15740, partial [Thermomicrobiales bacterium]
DKTFQSTTASDPAVAFKATSLQTSPLIYLRDSGNSELARITADSLNNTWFGKNSGSVISTGSGNVGLGADALALNRSGGANVAVGSGALKATTTGSSNIAIGSDALKSNLTGGSNIAIGHQALQESTAGQYNTGIGFQAAIGVGYDYATAFGVSTRVDANYGASIGTRTIVTANYGAAFGTDAKVLLGGTGSVAIGKDAQTSDPNVIQLGTSETVVRANNFVPTPSDIRDKADVRDTILGLDFIAALRPVDYRYDFREDYRPAVPAQPGPDASDAERAAYATAFAAWAEASKLANLTHDGSKKRNRFHHGLIAQEVENLLRERGIDFGGFQDGTMNGGDDRKMLAYSELISPLIKAVQDLMKRDDDATARIADLEARLAALER